VAAPPVHDAAAAGVGAEQGDGSSSTGDLTGLPGVPHIGAAPSSSASSEYDELQKRFEALKKA
jgi:hypothetical protein